MNRPTVRLLLLTSIISAGALTAAWADQAGSAAPAAPPARRAAAPFPVTVDAAKDEFCLIVVPDTQRYAAYFPEVFRRQFQWIRDQVEPLQIKFVMHVGDIVEENADAEWKVAEEAFGLIDGVVPYLAVPGNHDYTRAGLQAGVRDSSRYNALFSPWRFAGRPWYGGHKGITSDNSFAYFTAGGQDYMVLGLEYGPTDETLEWADQLVSNHEDRHKVIVVTHCYMYFDDTRVGPGDQWSPRQTNQGWNDGEGIWDKFIAKRENVAMVVSGHIKAAGTGRLISQTKSGAPVLQMLSNYQFLGHGGEGFLRILKFSPQQKKLEVYTYSPWTGRSLEEPGQRFSVDVPWMFP